MVMDFKSEEEREEDEEEEEEEEEEDEDLEMYHLEIDEGSRGEGIERKPGRSKRDHKVAAGESKILCRICGDGAVRHIHYGGHCCFSCKAFFRRAVNWQNKNSRNFQCKFEGNCEINVKNRKTCQSCRFQKCVSTGMNPSWVLSDDQRKKRFKKYKGSEAPSPTGSQDLSRDGKPDSLPEKGRRRAKSAPDKGGVLQSLSVSLPCSQPASPQDRRKFSFFPSSGASRRLARFSGDAETPIKTEPEVVLSPLREDSLCYGFNPAEQTPVKAEPPADLGPEQLDKLQTLISSCDFNSVIEDCKEQDRPPDRTFCVPFSLNGNYPSEGGVPGKRLPLELSPEEMMSLLKLEMSYENSSFSFPLMSAETRSIWTTVEASCNFSLLNNRLTHSLLSEAVELCLRRNLIFLQENGDFTSLDLETRKQLYLRNMGKMCHVRGVMQHSVGSRNFTCLTGGPNQFQISYKNQKTGKISMWNMGDETTGPSEASNVFSGAGAAAADEQSSNLLMLAEDIWRLNLERGTFLVLLLVVLFSTQDCVVRNPWTVNRLQNKYLGLLYRYLYSKYGEFEAKRNFCTLMKLVMHLLIETN